MRARSQENRWPLPSCGKRRCGRGSWKSNIELKWETELPFYTPLFIYVYPYVYDSIGYKYLFIFLNIKIGHIWKPSFGKEIHQIVVSSSACYFKLFQNKIWTGCGWKGSWLQRAERKAWRWTKALCVSVLGEGARVPKIIDLVPTNNEFHCKFKRDSCLRGCMCWPQS